MEDIIRVTEILEEDSQYGKYLTFALGEENYGIAIKNVTEIIGIQKITSVPELPNYMKGIINLRGKIIPVIDIRLKFKKEPIPYDDRTCIVVIDINQTPVGFIVDSVDEVLTISDKEIASPPDNKTGFNNKFISGIGRVNDQVHLLLDCNQFVIDSELINTSF